MPCKECNGLHNAKKEKHFGSDGLADREPGAQPGRWLSLRDFACEPRRLHVCTECTRSPWLADATLQTNHIILISASLPFLAVWRCPEFTVSVYVKSLGGCCIVAVLGQLSVQLISTQGLNRTGHLLAQ